MNTVQRYRRRLTFALRARDVPGDVIGEALAQVEAHVADTGEDPVAAFGPAREYARTFPGPDGLPRRWPWYVLNWVLGALFGCLAIIGVLGQARGETVLGGLDPVLAIIVGVLGLIGYVVAIGVIWATRVRDPRMDR